MLKSAAVVLVMATFALPRVNADTQVTNVVTKAAKQKPLLAQRTWETDGTMPIKPKAAKRYPKSDDAILVRINGTDITYGKLKRYSEMMAFLLANRKPSLSKDKAQIEQFKKRNQKKFSDMLYQRTLIDTCLAHSNVVLSAAVAEAKKKDFAKSFGRKGQTFDELKSLIQNAGFEKEFNDNLNFDIRFQSYVLTACSNEYYVSQADLERTKKNLAAYNARANATNDFVEASARSLLTRLRAGEVDFAKMADEFSQDEEKQPGGDMGDCDENDFLDEKDVWVTISRLKVGEMTELIESDSGYAIYKLVKQNTAEESQTGAPSLKLARIYYRKAFVYPDETDEELMSDIETEKREALFGRLVSGFLKSSEISYPEGKYDAL